MTGRGHLRLVPIDPPAIVRPATLEPGTMFWWQGRPLKVAKVYGTDAAAPVIVEELTGDAHLGHLAGQYAIWSLDMVQQAILEQARRRPKFR